MWGMTQLQKFYSKIATSSAFLSAEKIGEADAFGLETLPSKMSCSSDALPSSFYRRKRSYLSLNSEDGSFFLNTTVLLCFHKLRTRQTWFSSILFLGNQTVLGPAGLLTGKPTDSAGLW